MTVTITLNMVLGYLGFGLLIILLYSIKPMIRFFRDDDPWRYVNIKDMLSWVFIPLLFIISWIVLMPGILMIDFVEKAERNSLFRKIMYYRPFCRKEK